MYGRSQPSFRPNTRTLTVCGPASTAWAMIRQLDSDGSNGFGIAVPPETARRLVRRVGSGGPGRGWLVQVERPQRSEDVRPGPAGVPDPVRCNDPQHPKPDHHSEAGGPRGYHGPGDAVPGPVRSRPR